MPTTYYTFTYLSPTGATSVNTELWRNLDLLQEHIMRKPGNPKLIADMGLGPRYKDDYGWIYEIIFMTMRKDSF